MYKHILMPIDGSHLSERAMKAGIQLAKSLDARLTALFVSEATYIDQFDSSSKPRADAALAEVSKEADSAGVVCKCISAVGDTPQQCIVQFARDNACDLIIMGTHGRSRVGKFLLGSTAASVLADCEIPVLLYR